MLEHYDSLGSIAKHSPKPFSKMVTIIEKGVASDSSRVRPGGELEMTHVATKNNDKQRVELNISAHEYYQKTGHFYCSTCYCRYCKQSRYVARSRKILRRKRIGKKNQEWKVGTRRVVEGSREWYKVAQTPIKVGRLWTRRSYIPPTYRRIRVKPKTFGRRIEKPSEVFLESQRYLDEVFGPVYVPSVRKLYKSPYDTTGSRVMDRRDLVLPEGGSVEEDLSMEMELEQYLDYREDFLKFVVMLSHVGTRRRMRAWRDLLDLTEFRSFLKTIPAFGDSFERQFLDVDLCQPSSFSVFDDLVIPESGGYFFPNGFGLKESARVYIKIADFVNSVDGMINKSIDFVFGRFGSFIKEMKDIVVSFLRNIFNKIRDMICGVHENVSLDLLTVTCYILVACLGVGFGYLTYTFLNSIIPGIVCSEAEAEGYKVNDLSTASMIAAIFSVFTLATGTALTGSSANSIRYLGSLANTVSSMDKLWMKILEILPSAFVEYVTVATSSEERQEVVKWIRDSEKVSQVAKISSIFSRPEFSLAVEKLIRLSPRVISNCANEERAVVLMHYSSLMKISSTLHQGKAGASRVKPFVIHMYGDPGVGKSVNLDKIVQELGFVPSQVYSRNCADNYWSGFLDQPVVAIDEFMNDVDEIVNLKTRSEFMYLASSVTYMPNMASVDPSSIGVKGQTANPEVVVTMNNDYCRDSPNCSDVDYIAHLRRRNVVIRCLIKPQYKKRNGQLDKDTLFSTEQGKSILKDRAWCSFKVLEPEHNGPSPRVLRVFDDFKGLSDFLRDEFQKHKDMSVQIAGAHAGEMNSSNIDDILDSLDFGSILAEGLGNFSFKTTLFEKGNVDFEIPKEFPVGTLHNSLLSLLKNGHVYLSKPLQVYAHGLFNVIQRTLRSSTSFSPIDFPREFIEAFSNSDIGASIDVCGIGLNNIFSVSKKGDYEYFGSLYRGAHCQTAKLHYHQCNGITEGGTQCGSRIYCITSVCGREYCYKRTCSSGIIESVPPVLAGATPLMVDRKSDGLIDQVNSLLSTGLTTTFGVAFLAGTVLGFVKSIIKAIILILPESAKPKKSREHNRHMYVKPEGGSDPHIIKIVHENKEKFSMGFGIHSTVMVTISHNLLDSNGGLKYEKLKLERDSEVADLQLNKNNITLLRDYDLVIIDVSNAGFSPFKDIRKRLLKSSVHNQIDCCNGALVDLYQRTVFPTRIETAGPIVYETGNGNCFNPGVVYKYYAETMPGSCGSMLLSKDSRFCNKIIGVHVAGQRGNFRKIGYSIPLYQEMFELGGVVESGEIIQAEGCSWFQPPRVEVITPMVANPGKTKLKKSAISDDLMEIHARDRVPALLKKSGDLDPVEVFVESIERIPEFSTLEEDDVEYVEEAMYERYRGLFQEREKRLSVHEAIRGVPGLLSALDLSTSAGYPHSVRGMKKTDYVLLDSITPELEEMIYERIKQIDEGVCPEHYWIGYFKDELVKIKKRQEGRTRVIFCGDFVTTIAFRVLYGYRILIFNNSRREMGHAIGYNQYSADMNKIYEDLVVPGSRVQYIAGDYKSFDKYHHPQVRYSCFKVLGRLFDMSPNHFRFLLEYESSPMVLENRMIIDPRYHKSGSLFTTILNCLVNEFYVRYAFLQACPGRGFDEYCRIKTLGDDHIVSVSDRVDFNPLVLSEHLKKLGQIYTNDNKEECTADMREFSEISFLGSVPRKMSNGKYVGVAKKSHMDGLHYTRNGNLTLVSEVQDRIDLLSLGDQEHFDLVVKHLRRCLLKAGFSDQLRDNYKLLQREVSDRTTGSDCNYIQAEGGLTQFHTNQQTAVEMKYPCRDIEKGMKEHPYDLHYGPESCIRRSTGTWASSETAGTLLFRYRVPGDILGLGDGKNLQNMPFERHIYVKFDVEVTVQINATNFQQGLLVLFFFPLGYPPDSYHRTNWTSLPHVFVGASKSNSGTLRINFSFPRNAINTFGDTKEEITGTVCLGVISPLKTGTGTSDSATWNFYSSFKNCEFYLPRPVNSGQILAEGNVSSSVNTYNISDVAGSVPVSTQLVSDQSSENTLVPLDNPPLAGGGVPVQPQFCSMSKSVGPNTTISMQLDQKALDRCNDFNSSNIESIVSKPCLWFQRNWSTSNAIGTNIILDEMGTFKFFDTTSPTANAVVLPNSAIINMCTFWRADLVFEVVVVKTPYHSGRLTFVSAYGAPSLQYSEANVYKNEVLDFGMNSDGEDISRHKIIVPYNAPTEFLRTYEGDDAPDRIENTTMGIMGIYVTNQLRAPASVSGSVEVLVFISFENVVLAVPRPEVFFKTGPRVLDCDQKVTITGSRAVNRISNIVPEGFGDDQVNGGAQEEAVSVKPVRVTDNRDQEPPSAPCKLNVGQKFENRVVDLLEIGRRYIVVNPFFQEWISQTASQSRDYYTFLVEPFTNISEFFAGYSGSLKYRVFTQVDDIHEYENQITFYPLAQAHQYVFPHLIGSGANFKRGEVEVEYSTTATGSRSGSMSREVLIATYGPKTEFIDFQVPFQSHFNYCVRKSHVGDDGAVNVTFESIGVVSIPKPTKSTPTIYQGLGDDFRFCHYRPPHVLTYKPPTITATGTFDKLMCIGGFYKRVTSTV
ncbi:hypothetical protein [Beihai picorna-like virus 69]|uniref:hypothetical protein n=1 Tax=Beihai picorna-like virus 69 TaxID=1922615 RepID=UPI000909E0C3|nr:hypothetical protein [Beihai picorna-like virus 69]APG77926.1 hypothetical protein [Beihai picorna-like virus 69]